MSGMRNMFAHLGALILLITSLFFAAHHASTRPAVLHTTQHVSTSVAESGATSTASGNPTPAAIASTSTATPDAKIKRAEKASIQAVKSPSTKTSATTSPNDIVRIQNPYSTPPLPFETVNTDARAALVNIICTTSGGALHPISGSGIILDPKGIVLTNAHVAQYVLIAQSGKTDLSCVVRTGSPAVSTWVPVVMYMPSAWVDVHATDIVKEHALGTGEHDFALLYLSSTVSGSPLPDRFPSLAPDAREAIGFVDDPVLVAGYPVEFLGGGTIEGDLYPLTSITTVKQLLTFSVGSADALSLGGVLEAQSGSSGGAVVNQWEKVIGLVTTTSAGATTGARDLHAISTAYINRDLIDMTGKNLAETLSQDPAAATQSFLPIARRLQQTLFSVILSAQR